jgi:hypothetical protein
MSTEVELGPQGVDVKEVVEAPKDEAPKRINLKREMLPKYSIRFIKDDGTVKGAWIATGITFLMTVMFAVVIFVDDYAANFAKVGEYILWFYSISISAYFLSTTVKDVASRFGGGSRNGRD